MRELVAEALRDWLRATEGLALCVLLALLWALWGLGRRVSFAVWRWSHA